MWFRFEDFCVWNYCEMASIISFLCSWNKTHGNLFRELKENMNCMSWENPVKDLFSLGGNVPICQTYLVTLSQFLFSCVFWERREELLLRYKIIIMAQIQGSVISKRKTFKFFSKPTPHAPTRAGSYTTPSLYHITECDDIFYIHCIGMQIRGYN